MNLSNKFFLRPSTINDFDEIFKLRKNKKLWKYTSNSNFNYSYKIQKRYYKKKINVKKNLCFSIISVNNNFIGLIQLTNVNKNFSGQFNMNSIVSCFWLFFNNVLQIFNIASISSNVGFIEI